MRKAAERSASNGRADVRELRSQISPERRARNAAATKALLEELPLPALRHARDRTQAALAQTMECGQDEISKLERRTDMLVSSLRRYVEAMGGQLDIVATFPDGKIHISGIGASAEPQR